MKIAIFSDNFYPEISGIADSIIVLAQELANRGHEIIFYVPNYSRHDYRVAGLEQKELALGPEIKIRRLFSYHFPSGTKQGRAVLPGLSLSKIVRDKPEVICTELPFGVGLDALLAARRLKIPFIGTNHTAITEYITGHNFLTKRLKLLSLKYLSWYYSRCDLVTAPSQTALNELLAFGLKRPTQVVSNPLDLKVFHAVSENERQAIKSAWKLSPQTVVFAGRLSQEKKIDILLQAFKLVVEKVPNVNLALAGDGQDREALKILSDSLGLKNQVKFLGRLDKADLARLYQASEVFATASTSEIQPLTVLQSMACGCPPVVVDARGLPECVSADTGRLVPAGDYQSLAKEIVKLLNNDSLRQELSLNGQKSMQELSGAKIAEKWEEIFKKLVSC